MPGGKRLEQRGQRDPLQSAQSPDVAGQQVILDNAPELRSVGTDDDVVISVHQSGASRGFAALEVGAAFSLDHRLRNAQSDAAVDCGPGRAVLDGDLISEV